MFGQDFWVYSVMWNYGSGKTSWTFLDLCFLDKNTNLIISNIPYSFVDIHYDTKEELNKILDSIINYCKITNRDIKKYYNERFKYKNIILVVDEAHLYFDARAYKDYSKDLDCVLTQCRKRNIQSFFISQRLKRIDINIRRLTDFVIRYDRYSMPVLLNTEFVNRYIYTNEWALADIQGDDNKTYIMSSDGKQNELEPVPYDKESFSPLTRLFGRFYINSDEWKPLWEKWNTLYIAGLDSKYANLNDPFLEKIQVKSEYRPKPKTIAEEFIPNFYSLYKNIDVKLKWRSNNIQGAGFTYWRLTKSESRANRTILSWGGFE